MLRFAKISKRNECLQNNTITRENKGVSVVVLRYYMEYIIGNVELTGVSRMHDFLSERSDRK